MHVASDSEASHADYASDTDFSSDTDYVSDTAEGTADEGKEYIKLAEATDEREKGLTLTEGQQSTQRQCANYGKHMLSKGVLRHHVSVSPPKSSEACLTTRYAVDWFTRRFAGFQAKFLWPYRNNRVTCSYHSQSHDVVLVFYRNLLSFACSLSI